MALSASSVAGSPARVFRAGACQVDVTPTTFPVIINGSFLERTAGSANDRLMSRALVLDDGRTKIAVVVVDSLMMTQDMLDDVKQAASRATGIPADHMLISATHTHSAPSVMACLGSRADAAYCRFLPGQIVKSIVLACEHLEPARIGWAVVRDYQHNHCRRWVLRPDRIGRDPFGEATVRAMMHPGHQSANHVGPAGPADPDLSLLAVQSTDGRAIAVLANYALHYKGSAAVSGDFCGRFGAVFSSLIGADNVSPAFVGMMSQGTSGDSMWMDYAKPRNDPGLEAYTLAVAEVARAAYEQIEYQSWVPLAMAEARLTFRRRVPDADSLAWARSIAEGIPDDLPRNHAEVYAREALCLHEEPEVDNTLQAIRIGDLGITALPHEVYGITGLKLKAQSPLAQTFNIELANGAWGYIPPPEQHHLGGYTTWPARTAGLEVEAEPKIVETLLGLLEQVSGKPRTRREPPAEAYVRTVLEADPLAFWRLDDFDGTTARDASGNGCDGIYEPGVAYYLPGRSSHELDVAEQTPQRSVHFAGGRMHAVVGPLGPSYSVAMWCWNGLPVGARQVTGYLFAVGNPDGDDPLGDHLAVTGAGAGDGVLRFSNGHGTELSGRTPLRPRAWHHLVLVRNGRRLAVYLNGTREPEIVGEAELVEIPDARLFFGGRYDRQDTWEGKLDDIAVYGRVLAADEVAALYNASGLTPPKPLPPPKTAPLQPTRPHAPEDLQRVGEAIRRSNPVAWWTLHEAAGTHVPDARGGGYGAVLEPGAAIRRPGSAEANFTGGRAKAVVEKLGESYSVEMWIRNQVPVTSRPVTGYFFSRGRDQDRAAAGDHLGIGGTAAAAGRLIVFNGNQRNELLEGTTRLPLDSWNHVVLVRQGERVRVYLNGQTEPEIDGRLVPTFDSDHGQLFLGGRNDRFAPFVGRIDQVAVYDRALPAEEIAAHFATAGLGQ
jgi:hypothetical protein